MPLQCFHLLHLLLSLIFIPPSYDFSLTLKKKFQQAFFENFRTVELSRSIMNSVHTLSVSRFVALHSSHYPLSGHLLVTYFRTTCRLFITHYPLFLRLNFLSYTKGERKLITTVINIRTNLFYIKMPLFKCRTQL